MVFGQNQIVAGHFIQLVETRQLLGVPCQPLPRLGQQLFAGSDRFLEANIGVGLLAKRDITLEGVQRDTRVFPPGGVCQLKGITTPTKLVQVTSKLLQKLAPLLQSLQSREQLARVLRLEYPLQLRGPR